MEQCSWILKGNRRCVLETGHRGQHRNPTCACGREPKAKSHTVCRLCARFHANNSYHKRRGENPGFRYGLSPEEYQRLFSLQHGRCAICFHVLDTKIRGSHRHRIHVDHAHEDELSINRSQAVRGLLCPLCNRLLGYIETAARMGLVVETPKLTHYRSRRPIVEMRREPESPQLKEHFLAKS